MAVAIGAFGAHALRPVLEANGRADTFELAVRYEFYHAFAILFTAMLMKNFASAHLGRAVWCFAGGIIVFSGSLYVLSVSGVTVWGAVTPVGGVLLIAAWVFLFLGINAKGPK